ncbi:MAG: hypothetical protein C0410_04220 [Anaerolinea sp.]|nr:hypothetical protein [Anaerolinea sp.]
MPAPQIAARLKGDDYQARFFWYLAIQLLIPGSNIKSVSLEYDAATHVDDVAVFYKPPDRSDWGGYQEAEFYQVKYHVDHSNGYSADVMMDPTFINSPKDSLLQRFYKAYTAQRIHFSTFTLNLVSNWTWYEDDLLAKSIRDGCQLPKAFFVSSKKSKLGIVREKWIEHLGIDDATFLDFCQKLRFNLNYFSNSGLNKALSDRLQNAGLIPLDHQSLISPYDDLGRKIIVNQKLDFDKDSLLKLCKAEGLVSGDPIARTVRTIGIRSFTRFAENLEIETDSCISIDDRFEGRFPKGGESWINIANLVEGYLNTQLHQLGLSDNKLILDCHSSLSFLAGNLATHRSQVYPAGPRPLQEMFKPQRIDIVPSDSLWKISIQKITDGACNLAVAVSVSNQIDKHVVDYLHENQNDIGTLLILENASGTGSTSVRDANHAWALAISLIQEIRKYQISGYRTLLFICAPNFLTFYIGQLSRPLGKITLFEYDLDIQDHGTYFESFSIPLPKDTE